MGVFQKAIESMDGVGGLYRSPEMFKHYALACGIGVSGTAQHISVQSFSQLSPELRDNNIMVFRLGKRPGENGTYFSLAKTKNGWDDYFLFDDELFDRIEILSLGVNWRDEHLFSFSVMPTLTETSHVNLALAAGVLTQALNLDDNSLSIPATGRGNYTFKVRPHIGLDACWDHISGQVEIDSVFVGARQGKKHLFVIEAKSGKYPDSLPKHKLVYPMLSIIPNAPKDYKVVPVYMRIQEDEKSLTFYVAECELPEFDRNIYVNELRSNRVCVIRIEK